MTSLLLKNCKFLAIALMVVLCVGLLPSIWAKPMHLLSAQEIDTLEKVKICEARNQAAQSSMRTLNSVSADAACSADSELTEGPYFVREEYIRSDLTDGYPGIPLELTLKIYDVNTCSLANQGLVVELWGSNSFGQYAGMTGISPDTGRLVGTCLNTSKTDVSACLTDLYTFNRGVQVDSAGAGSVTFATIMPGYYSGRTAHFHLMVHAIGDGLNEQERAAISSAPTGAATASAGVVYAGQNSTRHIGQLFFQDSIIENAFSALPSIYPSPSSGRNVSYITYENDGIAQQASGRGLIDITYVDSSDITKGLVGTVNIYVDFTKSYSIMSGYYSNGTDVGSDSMPPGPGPRPGPGPSPDNGNNDSNGGSTSSTSGTRSWGTVLAVILVLAACVGLGVVGYVAYQRYLAMKQVSQSETNYNPLVTQDEDSAATAISLN